MNAEEHNQERLTEYERAICYYTIPRVTSPLTFGLVAAFSALLLGTFLALVYGIRTDNPAWRQWGAIAFGVSVVVSVATFLARSIRNEIQKRDALAEAESLPNVESGFDALPDPFASHLLLRYPQRRGNEYIVTDNRGNPKYEVKAAPGRKELEIRSAEDGGVLCVRTVSGPLSFVLAAGIPGTVVATRGDEQTATLTRRFNLGASTVDIDCGDAARAYTVRAGGIYRGNELLGRVYVIRGYVYLDIDETALNDGTLSFFLAMM